MGLTPTSQPLELEHVVTRSFSSALTDKSYTPHLSLQGLLISLGASPTTTVATPTVPASMATTGLVQQEHQSQGQQSSPHRFPSASSNSASPVSNPPDNTEDEQLDSLVSALSFSTAPGKLLDPLLSMHVSVSIKKRIWAGCQFGLPP